MNVRTGIPLAGHQVRPVIRYEPPIQLARAQLAAFNTVATRRLPIVARLAGTPLAIVPVGLETPLPEPLCHFGLGSDRIRPVLSLPQSLVERLVGSVQVGLGLPEEPLRSLMVELALADLLDALDCEISISTRLEPADAPQGNFDRLVADVRWEDWQGRACLCLPRMADGALAALSDVLRALPEAPAALNELPLALRFEIGASRLPMGLLASLRPGDVVLAQTYYPASGEILVTSGRIAAKATLAARTATLRGPFSAIPVMETSMNQTGAGQMSSASTDATLDQLEISLTFELGRQAIDLRTLRTMAPGRVFDLGRDIEGSVDILANGKRIGTGEIVRVGDTIGVRATRLFLHE